MCNSRRRCPGCQNPSAKERHNWRRRHNRAVRKALISWANNEDNIADTNVREFVRKLPPGEAKHWAQAAGAPSWIANPSHTNPRKPSHPAPEQSPFFDDPNHPATRAAIATALSIQGPTGHGDEERRLLTSKITDSDHFGEGINTTFRLQFTDGSLAFFKPLAEQNFEIEDTLGHEYPMQAQHEIAAWKIAQHLGPTYTSMVPPTVLREVDGQLGTLSQGYPGDQPDSYEVAMRVDPNHMHNAAVFDAVTGQRDRHPGNTLVYPRGDNEGWGISLIDHGFTFTKKGEYSHNFSVWRILQQGDTKNDSSLTDEHIEALTRLQDTNLDFLRGIVHPDRLEYRRHQIRTMIATRTLPPLPLFGHYE